MVRITIVEEEPEESKVLDMEPPSKEEQTRFDALCKEIVEALEKEDKELAQSMKKGLSNIWHRLPLVSMSESLRHELKAEECRRILFWPTSDDMMYYPLLLESNSDVVTDPKDIKKDESGLPVFWTFTSALTMLYLHHSNVPALVVAFCKSPRGLHILSTLIAHTNPVVRGQAVDCMMGLIRHEELGLWDRLASQKPITKVIRDNMFHLVSKTSFMRILLKDNYEPYYPLGSFYCLQVFATCASWLRFQYAPSGQLKLEKPILRVLFDWSHRKDVVPPEEKELAKKLFEDFGRTTSGLVLHMDGSRTHKQVPVVPKPKEVEKEIVEAQEKRKQQRSQGLSMRDSLKGAPASDLPKMPPKVVKGSPNPVALAEKERGTTAFQQGKLEEAMHHYKNAMQADPDNVVLVANLAACYLKRAEDAGAAKAVQGAPLTVQALDDLQHVLDTCDHALALDPQHDCVLSARLAVKYAPKSKEAKRLLKEAEGRLRLAEATTSPKKEDDALVKEAKQRVRAAQRAAMLAEEEAKMQQVPKSVAQEQAKAQSEHLLEGLTKLMSQPLPSSTSPSKKHALEAKETLGGGGLEELLSVVEAERQQPISKKKQKKKPMIQEL